MKQLTEISGLMANKRFAGAKELFDESFGTSPADSFILHLATLAIDDLQKGFVDEDLLAFTAHLLKKISTKNLLVCWDHSFTVEGSPHVTVLCAEEMTARSDEILSEYGGWDTQLIYRAAKFQKMLLESMDTGVSMRHVLQEFAAVIKLYGQFPDTRHIKFSLLFEAIFQKLGPNDIELDDFLPVASRLIPFHPFIVAFDAGRLLPRVWNPVILLEEVCQDLIDYISVEEDHMDRLSFHAILTTLDFISAHGEFDEKLQAPIASLLIALFPYIQDHELGKTRVDIMRRAVEIIKRCTPVSRVLILKRLAEHLCRTNLDIKGAPMLLAWIVDLYKDNLAVEIFQVELGSFWVLLEKVRYEDIPVSLAYYTAVQNLFQVQILRRIRIKMVAEVKRRLIDSLRDQLGDWITLQNMKAKAEEEEPQSLGGVMLPRPIESIDILIYNFEYTNSLVADLPSE